LYKLTVTIVESPINKVGFETTLNTYGPVGVGIAVLVGVTVMVGVVVTVEIGVSVGNSVAVAVAGN
jgi:hypothetical protein